MPFGWKSARLIGYRLVAAAAIGEAARNTIEYTDGAELLFAWRASEGQARIPASRCGRAGRSRCYGYNTGRLCPRKGVVALLK